VLSDAIFSAADRGGRLDWQQVLLLAARIEALQIAGTAVDAGPIPQLSTGWLDAAAEDSPEWRLAAALGSAAAEYRRDRARDGVRANVLPLDGAGRRYAITDKRITLNPRVVFTGRDAVGDLIALAERRILEATQRGQRILPLVSRFGCGARPSDLAAFIEGRVDVSRVLWLARGLMAVRWESVQGRRPSPVGRLSDLDEAWQALRLCGLPFEVCGRRVPIDAAMVRRLASGDASGAVASALRRLAAAGLHPPVRAAVADPATARRWAAALAFPIDRTVAEAMVDQFQNQRTMENA